MWDSLNLNCSWVISEVDHSLVNCDLSKYNSVLELGCGHGINSNYLSKKINEVDAIDISKFAIDYCKKTIKSVNFIHGDFFDVEFSKKYELIFDRGFFHSLPDKRKGILKIRDLLEKNGCWISIIGSTKGLTDENKGPPSFSLDDIKKFIEPHLQIIDIKETYILNKKTVKSPAWIIRSAKI